MTTSAETVGKEANDVTAKGHKIVDAAGDLVDNASEQVKQYKEKAKNLIHEANNTSLAEVEEQAGAYIRENPVRCMAGAAVAGFLLGMLVSRR
ncbi:MAG: C-terminal glycine zipper region [Candidatus Sumerlaeota bacterium]|nr:C-terminal glycine zipper region [Candidatus Sumerlaeota bacterium]